MPTITFSLRDLCTLVGKDISVDDLKDLAHYGKGDFDNYDWETDEVKIDFGDTNLPYLWSAEGFARLLKGVLGLQKGIPKLKLNKADYKVIVDKSVLNDRPFIACFAAKGKKIDDYLLKQIIQLQEKFCETYGRKRKKVSIGLYSYSKLDFPVHYKMADPKTEFVPLEFKSKMSLKEILENHPKGKEYSWILEGMERYPILHDSKGEIMSFIPIINSNFTGKLDVGDEDIFFEATGNDEEAVNLAATIFAYAMSDRDFKIYSVEMDCQSKKIMTPLIVEDKMEIKSQDVKNLFGLNLKENEIKKLLEMAQYDSKNSHAIIPPYRKDILHPFDVVEDIGIMYGYNKVPESKMETFTSGSGLEFNDFVDKARELIIGLGYQEIISPILANEENLYKKMNIEDTGTVEILDYMSETYSVVRSWILPNLMEVFSRNKHVTFPQRIFEEGVVNVRKEDKIIDANRIAVAVSHEKTDYTEIRQVLDFVMRIFGYSYDIEEAEHKSFIEGRVGRIIVRGKKVGFIGEINPFVLESWGLEMPVAAMELNLSELFELKNK